MKYMYRAAVLALFLSVTLQGCSKAPSEDTPSSNRVGFSAQSVAERDPEVGQYLTFRNSRCKVTEKASYRDNQGYESIEWRCDIDGESYFIKEIDENKPVRWLFTRQLAKGSVTLSDSKPLDHEWLAASGKNTSPELLIHEYKPYYFSEMTDGVYTDGQGTRSRKITWDYWDKSKTKNLAIEVWEDGTLDFYLGYAINSEEAVFGKSR